MSGLRGHFFFYVKVENGGLFDEKKVKEKLRIRFKIMALKIVKLFYVS